MMERGSPLVRALDVGKTYRLHHSNFARLASALTGRRGGREQVALEGVTFDLHRGESLGIIGHNGAGKSTLLKILAGVVQPTRGTFETTGRVSSILELGSGFHPDFSGRDNIRLNAAMLGLGEEEVEERRPAIEAFCELGEFLDQPIKVYSTGMVMRLAFAIATQIEPEVLIVDEALSVGDGYFQKKCTDRLLELTDAGTALLFCSHAMYYVTSFCDRALWLDHGQVQALGPAKEVVADYEDSLLRDSPVTQPSAPALETGRAGPARFVEVEVAGGEVQDGRRVFATGGSWSVQLRLESDAPEREMHVGVGINRADGVEVFTLRTTHLEPLRGQTEYRVSFAVTELPLTKGSFSVFAFLLDESGLHVYDRQVLPEAFVVESPGYEFGVVRVEHEFHREV
ncbi:MAG: ABC transporter ATP-binding protein [Acidobacteriota bacterium]